MAKPKILIVDDEPDIVNLAKMILENEGFKTITAFDGNQGLEKAFSEAPDLILLDIRMPGIDGYEVCHRLKTDPKTKLIPVILFTVLKKWKAIEKSKKEGADSYIIKPFTPKALVEEVKKQLNTVS